jgi:hypothetical protein
MMTFGIFPVFAAGMFFVVGFVYLLLVTWWRSRDR